jgi:hypothetical protein
MNRGAKQLLEMSRAQLDELFRRSSAGTLPDGSFKGTFIIAPGNSSYRSSAELIRLMAWQGKVFDAKHRRVNNRVSPFGFSSVPARVYRGVSRFDGEECIILDYSKTSFIARSIRDEIREISRGVYLGKVYFLGTRMPDFVLEPALKSR